MARRTSPATRQAKRPSHGSTPKALVITGLAALAALTLALVYLALRGPAVEPEGAYTTAPSPAVTSTVTASPTEEPQVTQTPAPTETQTPSPAPSPSVPGAASAPTVLLSAGAEPGTLLRATMGACGAPGWLEASTNAGASWVEPTFDGVTNVSFRALDAGDGFFQTAAVFDEYCQSQSIRSYVSGVNWELAPAVTGAWALQTAGQPMIDVSDGVAEVPCTAVSVVGAGPSGVVLCADATVTTSDDGGVTWTTPVAVANASAVGIGADTFWVASANEPECAGVQVRSIDAGVAADASTCVPVDGLLADQIAVAAAGDALYVWAGDVFVTSFDRGATWE